MKHKVHWLLYESFSIIELRRPIYGLLGQPGRCKPFSVSFISVLRSVTHKLSSASQNSCFYNLACVIWNQGFSVVSDSFLWCLLFHSRGFTALRNFYYKARENFNKTNEDDKITPPVWLHFTPEIVQESMRI